MPRWLKGIRVYRRGNGGGAATRPFAETRRYESGLRSCTMFDQRTEDILESITDEFFAVDREWRYTYINERALQRVRTINGQELEREDVLGQIAWEVVP